MKSAFFHRNLRLFAKIQIFFNWEKVANYLLANINFVFFFKKKENSYKDHLAWDKYSLSHKSPSQHKIHFSSPSSIKQSKAPPVATADELKFFGLSEHFS